MRLVVLDSWNTLSQKTADSSKTPILETLADSITVPENLLDVPGILSQRLKTIESETTGNSVNMF